MTHQGTVSAASIVMIQCHRWFSSERAQCLAAHCLMAFTVLLMLQVGTASAATPLPAPPSWQQEYWSRFDTRDWEGAINSAEALVAAARPATAETGLRLAEALSLLGSAQLGKGNLVAAEAAFTEALQLTQKYADRSSAKLVDPLRGLGYTLAAEGKHEKAIPYMDRALLISRRSVGLFDLSQQGLLRQLATSLASIGEPIDGEKHMQYLLRMGEHAYGKNDPRMVPLHCVVARWYADVAQMDQARRAYRIALDVAEEGAGRNDVLVVEPLRGLARTFTEEIALTALGIDTRKERLTLQPEESINDATEPYNPRYIPMEGERALLRAIKTLDANPKASPAQLVETLVQTGDWYLMKMQSGKALPYYARAAAIIEDQQLETLGSAATLLSFPAQVYYPTPHIAQRNQLLPPNQIVERFVQVDFTVLPDGSIENARLVDKDASDRQASQTLEAIRDARYRPRFVNGQAVTTEAVSFRQVFRDHKESE
jgi:tetratricopeptide (TPR) repeat protein